MLKKYFFLRSKQCQVSTQIWVQYGHNQIWVKNVIKKCSWSWVYILNDIFKPTFAFVHILPNFVLKQPSIV